MKPAFRIIAVAAVLAGGVALAKEGVQNPAVKARQEAMASIAGGVKVLGDMAGEKTAFDAAAAEAAKAQIVAAAASVPTLFEPQEDDPASDARPEIWTSWDDFVAKAGALGTAAGGVDTSSLDGVKAGLGALGSACKDCHTSYRAM